MLMHERKEEKERYILTKQRVIFPPNSIENNISIAMKKGNLLLRERTIAVIHNSQTGGYHE